MDTVLKQRLIGALVLVALAVIFLPMLVKGPAPDSGVANVPLKAPDAPADGQFQTRELPLVTPGDMPSGGAVGMASAPAAPAPVQDNPDAADLATPAPAAAGSAAQPLPPTVAAGNYAVNFGAYSTPADADAVIARLKQAQLPGFREAATIGGRQAWRVRIGPYADRAQAESVRLQAVKVRNDVNAQVVTLDAPSATSVAAAAPAAAAPAKTETLPPEPAKPVAAAKPPVATAPKPEQPKPEPAKPAATAPVATAKPAPSVPAAPAASGTGFAVQLGAFGKAEDANALRDKVRAAGFSAFVEQVRTDKGALNRVRVGPVANRADAEQLRAQVASKVGISGMVRPHP